MATWEKYLERIYKNPKHPGSFSGPEKLYQAVKHEGKFRISKGRISKWLKGNSTYTFNRIAHRKFKRNGVIVDGIDSLWDADLMDFIYYKKANDTNCYILLMIDIFSRYAYLRPLKTKSSGDVKSAMESIFSKGRKPMSLRTDKGGEFTNVAISKFYDDVNIHHYVTFNETQANYAERCIKTIKTKIFRYMKEKNTHRYIDIIDDIIIGYNSSVHRSLGRSPNSVNENDEDEIRIEQYLIKNKKTKQIPIKKEFQKKKRKKSLFKYKLGDSVRISMTKGKFDREYDQKWSTETFKVDSRFIREKIDLYTISDLLDEEVEGTFYSRELQKVLVSDDEEHIVEKVLKRKGLNCLVKWKGWPKKFNSWIPYKDVKDL